MSEGLSLFREVVEIGEVIGSAIAATKSNRFLKKQDAVMLEEKLRYIRALCKAKGCAELVRRCLDEMDTTYRDITSRNYSGEMLKMALEFMALQQRILLKIIAGYEAA